ncbi:MAG: hypothetical protein ABW040_07860 [Microbacteriaceae bacterium]
MTIPPPEPSPVTPPVPPASAPAVVPAPAASGPAASGPAAPGPAVAAPEAALPAVVAPRAFTRSLWPAVIAAVVLVAGAIAVNVSLYRFPGNAPVEGAVNLLSSGALLLGALALVCVAIAFGITRRWRRKSLAAFSHYAGAHPEFRYVEPRPARSPWVMALIGAILAVASALLWLVLGGAASIADYSAGVRLRYMEVAAVPLLLSGPWLTGLALGVAGFRRDGGVLNFVLTAVAIVAGLAILAPMIAYAGIYGAGLSD